MCLLAPILVAAGATPQASTITAPSLPIGTISVYGAKLTFSATVAPASGTSPAPTGTVTFTFDGFAGTPQLLTDGVASVTTALTAGSHTITAKYSGDANYASATSLPRYQMVDKADTVMAMASNPPQINQPVAIRAAPTLVSPSAGYMAGTVSFTLSGAAMSGCSALPVENGAAVCNTTFTQPASLSVTATYSGDANTRPSSFTLPLTVGKVVAGAYLAAAPQSLVWGMPVALNTLLLPATGVPAPTGTVTYTEGTVTLGTAPVSAEQRASLVVPGKSQAPLGAGTHTITATYGGDDNYQTSSATIAVAVAQAATTLALTSAPAQTGQAVTLRATAAVVSPASGVPGGTITFKNGDAPIAGCTAMATSNGVAVCTTTFAQMGNTTVNAVYNGDVNTQASTATLQVTVNKVSAGIYTAFAPNAPVYGTPVSINVLLLGAAGVAAPTGTVTLSDGAATLGTVNVGSDGKASLVVPSGALAPLAVGTHSIGAVYNGDANYATSSSTALSIPVDKAATTIALASSPARIGQPLTLTASVAVVSPGNAIPSGTLSFTQGASAIAGCTGVALQNGVASCTTTFSQYGDFTIGAAYSGDANTSPSTGTMQLTIGKVTGTIQTTYTPAAPVYGVPVTVTASVTGTAGLAAPAGTVTFAVDAAAGVTVPLGADGKASLTLSSFLGAGAHTVTVAHSGDSNYGAASAAPLSVVIGKAGTTTSLTANTGAPLSATVTLVAPATGVPTGQVQFFQNGSAIGTATLAQVGIGYSATFQPASPSGSFWAVYQGDNNCGGSASQLVTMTTAAQVSISSDRNPSPAGQPVAFTIRVTGPAGAAAPGGTVQVTSDGVSIGSATLTAGQATLIVTSLDAGSHTIAASYSGDAVYGAVSGTMVQVVNRSTPTLTLTANPSTAVYGQPVTLTVQASGLSGTVQFLDEAAALGSAQASSGTATLVVSTLAVATHSLTAGAAGDSNTGDAVSAPVAVTVGKAQTTTTLSISGGSLRATVAVVAPGAGTPTGTVKFMDGTTNLVVATAAVANGTGTTAMPASAASLVAVYSGDANFQASNSASVAALTALNAASYSRSVFAPDEIVTLFGTDLSSDTVTASPAPTKSLGGTSVKVTDFSGVKSDADLMFVSPDQATFLMPPNVAPGPATVVVSSASRPAVSVTVTITPVAPGIFTLNGTGDGVAAAQAIRVRAGGVQDAAQDIAIYDQPHNQWIPMPIDLGNPGDTVYLILYGTGLRHFNQTPVCTIGTQKVPVMFAGAHGSLPGVDQINLILPRSLAGAGVVGLTLSVDGSTSNTVTLAFQ